MYKLSVCIPTYNRSVHLRNCLSSIVENNFGCDKIQICVSDNASTDNTSEVIQEFKERLNLKISKNEENLGMVGNFLKVIDMADGEFTWMVGDDDLLMPDALASLLRLLESKPGIDYFFVNTNHLNAKFIKKYPAPFSIKNLPTEMELFSKNKLEGPREFFELIDPKITFDFLGGIYLSVFRRDLWQANVSNLDPKALADKRTFSHFDNTFPHLKIFAHAFNDKKAYIFPKPLSVCLTGVREWGALNSLVMSVRLIEALEVYHQRGLSLSRFIKCKNFALKNFGPDLIKMFFNRKKSGFAYINPFKLIFKNILYPNFILSFFYPFFRISTWGRVFKKIGIR
jgi:glycosyltransferase involved in cell wall biosynthesis